MSTHCWVCVEKGLSGLRDERRVAGALMAVHRYNESEEDVMWLAADAHQIALLLSLHPDDRPKAAREAMLDTGLLDEDSDPDARLVDEFMRALDPA